MKDFNQLRLMIDEGLANLEIRHAAPQSLYTPAVYVLQQGGKRIRPVLALMACQLFGKDPQTALQPALGLEVFHNFTLLHDDVMDKASMRHGMPTVHVKWNANTAILSGDAMFAAAGSLIAKAPKACLPEVLDAFNALALGVCEGQQYDMDFESHATVALAEYMEMIRLKTAVLIAGALQIGAIIGGADTQDLQHLYSYGNKIGLAFQLQDDLLDLYADESKFGKKIGGDIRENKKTYLFIKGLEFLNEADGEKLQKIFSTPTTPLNEDGKVTEVKALYQKIDLKSTVNKDIEALFEQADAQLACIPESHIDPAAKKVLRDFVGKLLGREY
ncbi:MAG: polyprenyl synthetase family protein [Bacteroides sp.]|nr:polyprenyl synthetase family protein [Bacteroides sp.]MCM1086186.1 polyprenyl synthetase family protein [Bacteroides sp.]MCM1168650.1 polyprenyl synthetase family protein [Bacteroides sp.]